MHKGMPSSEELIDLSTYHRFLEAFKGTQHRAVALSTNEVKSNKQQFNCFSLGLRCHAMH